MWANTSMSKKNIISCNQRTNTKSCVMLCYCSIQVISNSLLLVATVYSAVQEREAVNREGRGEENEKIMAGKGDGERGGRCDFATNLSHQIILFSQLIGRQRADGSANPYTHSDSATVSQCQWRWRRWQTSNKCSVSMRITFNNHKSMSINRWSMSGLCCTRLCDKNTRFSSWINSRSLSSFVYLLIKNKQNKVFAF